MVFKVVIFEFLWYIQISRSRFFLDSDGKSFICKVNLLKINSKVLKSGQLEDICLVEFLLVLDLCLQVSVSSWYLMVVIVDVWIFYVELYEGFFYSQLLCYVLGWIFKLVFCLDLIENFVELILFGLYFFQWLLD